MLKTIKLIYRSYLKLQPLPRFGVNIILLVALWFVFYRLFRYTDAINIFYEAVTQYITDGLLYGSSIFLNIIGQDTGVYGRIVRIYGTAGVLLDRGCIGRNLIGLFAGFLLAYPGSIKTKLWYIPLGILMICFINILRISALAMTVKYAPKTFEFYHNTVFQYSVLALTFLMWYLWITKFSVAKKKALKNESF